jgi:hypothetical protein
MRRPITIIALTLILTPLLCLSSQIPKANSQTSTQSSARTSQTKGKVLVSKLPDKTEGVTLKNRTVRLKPGYKFVEVEDGTVAVARINGGPGVSGTWDCSCTKGSCKAVITGGALTCIRGTCTGTCELSVITGGFKTGVIRF